MTRLREYLARLPRSLLAAAIVTVASTMFDASTAHAQGTPNFILDRAAVAQAIARGAILWDVRDTRDYLRGHLPGAISIGDAARILRDEHREDFIPIPAIARILGSAGIDPAREIVVYGTRGTWNPYFAQYTIQHFKGARVSVYHDGFEGWVEASQPVSTHEHKLAAVELSLSVDPKRAIDTREVIAKLNQSSVQIVDARTAKEFEGEDIRAIRGGRVPGAINIPYEANWVDPDTPGKLARRLVTDNRGMSLKPGEELKKLYAKLDPEKETIVYCQSGARASETAGVLQQLGFRNVRVYDSSWLGYAAALDAPVENVAFVNIGALNARIGALQSRVEQLERELAQSRKPN